VKYHDLTNVKDVNIVGNRLTLEPYEVVIAAIK